MEEEKFKQVSNLREQLCQGKITRRDFVRYTAMLGLSLGATEALAACAPKPTPTLTPTSTLEPTSVEGPTPEGWRAYIPGTDNVVPTPEWLSTPRPPATPTVAVPRPTATPTPILWEEATWSCPSCDQTLPTQEALIEHILAKHARKIPGVRRVDKPTYDQFLVGPVERFDQKNTVFSRILWDKEYQEQLKNVAPRKRRESASETSEGSALQAGSIYVDQTAGSLHPNYRGYSGHVRDVGGLYGWDDLVNPEPYPASDPAEMSERIKRVARFYGADLVGICELDRRWVYSHYFDRETGAYGELEIPYKYAIVMGVEMDWEGINQSPGFPASAATALAYSRMAEIAPSLAKYIRALGHPAVPAGNDTAQSIPLAIDAGLGELGRNGLLATPEFGSRQRICKVLTDLPLQPDQPVDFGMQKFCEKCYMCAGSCPADAIKWEERTTEPTSISNRTGILRWPVNVSKCYLFWQENGIDCSNCIAVCPWSFPHRPWL
jgi:epoxyqueuosine reductase